jgi:putative membrane protein
MKNNIFKIIAITLCAVLALGVATAAGYVLAANSDNKAKAENTEAEELTAAAANAGEDGEVSKDETVYVLAGADGAVKKIIVSDWIKNELGKAEINDKSELSDIENVKGDESYTLGSDNSRVWDAQGNDIYYQGNIDKELPVDLCVTYKLDGKTVSPDELAGKSGRVTIRFDYTNKQYEYVEIDGKKERIYVPYAMLTGVLFDNDTFKNIEVSNGKLINDGSRTAVIGIAFPGLQENLAVDPDKFEIPNYVEITADAEDFDMGMTMTVATNEIFNEIDPDDMGSIGDLSGSLTELTDAMDQLIDGSSRLYDGLGTLLDKSGELAAGIDKLAAGAEKLKSGAAGLDAGAAELQSGAAKLSLGLNELKANNNDMNNGAKQVFETLLAAANTQLEAAGLKTPAMTIENYDDVLDAAIAPFDSDNVYKKALAQVTASIDAMGDSIYSTYIEQNADAVYQKYISQKADTIYASYIEQNADAVYLKYVKDNAEGLNVYTLAASQRIIATLMQSGKTREEATAYLQTEEGQAAVAAAVAGMTDAQKEAAVYAAVAQLTDDQKKQIISGAVAALTDEQKQQIIAGAVSRLTDDQKQQIKAGALASLTDEQKAQIRQGAIEQAMASDKVQSQLAAASNGVKQLAALKGQLDSYKKFYLGLQSYTAGVSQAADGADKLKAGTNSLKSGTSQLSGGISELCNGILTMKNGAPALVDGITKLNDGSMQLSDGLKEFNEKGIEKLVDALDRDIGNVIARLRATADVSKNYTSFSGISDEMDGQVKFIYRTDSIKAKEQ